MSLYFCLEVLHLNGKFTEGKKDGHAPVFSFCLTLMFELPFEVRPSIK